MRLLFRMWRNIILAVTLSVVFIPTALAHELEQVVVTFSCSRDASGRLFAECTFNDRIKATLLIDTGSSSSILSDTLVKRIGLNTQPAVDSKGKPISPPYLNGKQAQMVNVPRLLIGPSLPADDVPFLVAPAKFLSGFGLEHSEGVIGMNMFGNASVLFDFTNSRATLWYPAEVSEKDLKLAGLSDALEMPLIANKGHLYVEAKFSNGTTENLVVDTGAGQSFFSHELAKRLKLVQEEQRNVISMVGKAKAFISKPIKVNLGNLQIDDLSPIFVDDGQASPALSVLGLEVLGDSLLYINVPGKKMLLKQNAQVSFAGLSLRWNGLGKVTVMGVDKGSSAALANVQEGDELVEINGQPVKGMTPERLSAEVKKSNASNVALKVLSKGQSGAREVTLKLPP